MARKRNSTPNCCGNAKSIAVIVDGPDEKWYLELVRKHYDCPGLKAAKLAPNLPTHKKVEDLIRLAKEKADQEYQHVVLILDLDVVIRDASEAKIFQKFYQHYLSVKQSEAANDSTAPIPKNHRWMKCLHLILNNPCIEFWYLLHFRYTTKFYPGLEPELLRDLKSIPDLKDYNKSQLYYNKESRDLYVRLGGVEGLRKARGNASKNSGIPKMEIGFSQMDHLFAFFDKL